MPKYGTLPSANKKPNRHRLLAWQPPFKLPFGEGESKRDRYGRQVMSKAEKSMYLREYNRTLAEMKEYAR